MRRLTLALLLAGCCTLLTGTAAAEVKPEDAIKYRQGVDRVIGWNFGPMAAMAKAKSSTTPPHSRVMPRSSHS